MRAVKDTSVDRFVLWAGLGGGTGTGGVIPLMQHLVSKGQQVMLGLTIPRKKESLIVRMNAIKALTSIFKVIDSERNSIVPYVVIDNEQFDGGLASANEAIVRDFIRFTYTTTNTPADSAFDDTDFARLLNYRGFASVVRSFVPTDTLKGTDVFAKNVRESWNRSAYAKFSPEDALGIEEYEGKAKTKLIKKNEKSKIDCIHIYRRDSHVSYCQKARSERDGNPDGD